MIVRYLSIALLCSVLIPCALIAAPGEKATHLDRGKVPTGCSTCHLSFNFKAGGGPETCLVCHGDRVRSSGSLPTLPKGLTVATNDLKNIEQEFKKPYRHPTFDARGVHRGNEALPETDSRMPRHADCVDCHNPHYSTASNRFAGIRARKKGNVVSAITEEHELCYRCHAESANLPGRSTNKRAEFSLTNPSYHPVEGEGKNGLVISLIRPYREKKVSQGDIATLRCGDCHGSDADSAPKGPHGSSYEHILVDHYSTRDNQSESPSLYALCYRCHNRASILGNESFKYHALHIQGAGGTAAANGTSCFTCHNSHGSSEYKYLIRFNTSVVSPNSKGMLKFVEKGVSTFRGECYLSCHGVEHNPKSY